MNIRSTTLLAALVLALPVSAAAQRAQDFQLPPSNPTSTPSPQVQGPVDDAAPVTTRPRVIETARSTPTPTPTQQATPAPQEAPTPRPTISPGPVIETAPRQGPTQAPAVGSARPAPPQIEAPVDTLPETQAGEPTSTIDPPGSISLPAAEPVAPDADADVTVAEETGGLPWAIILAALAGLLALGFALFAWQRKRASAPPPRIERPVVAPKQAPAAAQVAKPAEIKVEAIKLTLSFAYATLDYRVSVLNRSTSAMSGVSVSADLVSAHGDLPVEQQVASAGQDLPQQHVFERIAPGQSVRYEGKVQLPVANARVLHQGSMVLLVPLLRLKVADARGEPQVRTFVIGQGEANAGRVAPFRLDEGLRSWSPVAARALD
ncbi:hypothetical protein K3179_02080 [Qipengyuania sp. GH38]|uniref:hypothetical protein n=1 Tax=Qipengyuania intermedia TaxID=2867244 RepID=UPI001C884512|nr:hypothetical protein [Qipengyuania intermedia]MBX7513329.1 hypothetical protein [Qipengyuania intermedia]